MPYATQANMVTRFGEQEMIQLTDRFEPQSGVIDVAVLAAAMTRAAGVVNGYLRTRFVVPLAPTPPELAHHAEGIARRYLYDDAAPEGVMSLYDEAIAWLKDVQKGNAQLDGAIALPAAGAGIVGNAQFNTVEQPFACRY